MKLSERIARSILVLVSLGAMILFDYSILSNPIFHGDKVIILTALIGGFGVFGLVATIGEQVVKYFWERE